MAGFSAEALAEEMNNIGRAEETVAQIKAQEQCEDTFKELDFAAVEPADLIATVNEKTEAVVAQVEIADDCNIEFGSDLASIAELLMSAITNPFGTALDALQDLMNSLEIKPPGFGLPDFDLSIPNFHLSLGGGFDIGSLLDGVGDLFKFPPLTGCATLLPDLGIAAHRGTGPLAERAKGIIKEGESQGLANLPKIVGNKKIKKGFDSDGNPTQIVVNTGVNAKYAQSDCRIQPPPPSLGTFEPPGYAIGGLRSNTNEPKPPVYEKVTTGLGTGAIIEKNNDPLFAELVKQKVGTGLATTANQSDFGTETLGTDYDQFAAELSLRGTNYGRTPNTGISETILGDGKGKVEVDEYGKVIIIDEQLAEELRKRQQQ